MEDVTMLGSIREEQLSRLMSLYQRDLLRMSYIYLRDLALAEDAVQETFIKVYKSMESFRGESSEKTWLMRIVINICKDMRRAGWFKYVDQRISLANLPHAQYTFTEKDNTITTEIMRLPRKQMETMLLYYYQGMSVYQIAEALGISVPSVSTRLKRAREQLKKTLEGGLYDE